MEVRAGIEPAYKGFADPCLTTWLPDRASNDHDTITYLRRSSVALAKDGPLGYRTNGKQHTKGSFHKKKKHSGAPFGTPEDGRCCMSSAVAAGLHTTRDEDGKQSSDNPDNAL